VKLVLGDRFVQSDMKVEFGPGMPAMVFHSYYGYDASEDRVVSYSIGNTGELEASDHVSWVDDSTLVVLSMLSQGGVPVVNRSITKIAGDEQTFLWEAANGTAGFATMVEGKMKKSEQGYAISDAEWSAGYAPVGAPAPMEKIGRIAGDYRMTGEFSMAPGAAPMRISGRETIAPVFGGSVLRMHVLGDPIPGAEGMPTYEGLSFLTWDPTRECYREFWLNNMGETSIQEIRFVGENKLVTTQTRLQAGEPQATRGAIELDESGTIVKVSLDRMSAGNQPERAFFAEYKKQEKAEPDER
jgi:hypothetical protein